MVEKSSMIRQFRPKTLKRCQDSLLGRRVGKEPAFFTDAQSGQTKAGGGDASNNSSIIGMNITSVFDQAGLGIGLFPKILNVRLLHVIQELVVFRRNRAKRTDQGGSIARLRLRKCQAREWQGSALPNVLYTEENATPAA